MKHEPTKEGKQMINYDLIIIGNGPAGLSAAIYGRRAGMKTLIIDKNPMSGGQVLDTYEVDNYPGLPGLSGMELAGKFKEHAEKLMAEFVIDTVQDISDKDGIKIVTCEKETYSTPNVIIATGASHRKLGVKGEEELRGAGVSYCATCDGAFFRNRTTAVVGGGDVALEDAIYLSGICDKVYLIHRRDEFRGARILQDEVKSKENIKVIYDTILDEIKGKDFVEELILKNKRTGETSSISVDGVFMAVGILPNTTGISGLPETDESGYIKAGEDCITSVPGIYAAGDVRTKNLRQIVTAAADGANAVTSIQRRNKV